MAHQPQFSVIIPALNEAKYLPKLLQDLVNQSFNDFEVIVVDAGSRDKTVQLAKEYSKSLPSLTILNSTRAHVCTQRNLGASHAKSDILIFSDADNRLPPFFLQGIKYRLESTIGDIFSVWLNPDITTPTNDTIAKAINIFLETQNSIKPKFFLESLFVIKKSAFHKVGGFDETVNYAEGKSFIQKAIKLGLKSKVIRDPMYTFSFRRLRKYGILNIAGRVARMELSELLGQDFHAKQVKKLYPMLGGQYFNKPNKAKNKFLKNISKLLKDF